MAASKACYLIRDLAQRLQPGLMVREWLGAGNRAGALDILQSVWMTVHRMLGKLQSPDAFRVWLYRIAHDQAVSELRRKSKRPVLFEETATLEPADHASAAEEAAFENCQPHADVCWREQDHRRFRSLVEGSQRLVRGGGLGLPPRHRGPHGEPDPDKPHSG